MVIALRDAHSSMNCWPSVNYPKTSWHEHSLWRCCGLHQPGIQRGYIGCALTFLQIPGAQNSIVLVVWASVPKLSSPAVFELLNSEHGHWWALEREVVGSALDQPSLPAVANTSFEQDSNKGWGVLLSMTWESMSHNPEILRPQNSTLNKHSKQKECGSCLHSGSNRVTWMSGDQTVCPA